MLDTGLVTSVSSDMFASVRNKYIVGKGEQSVSDDEKGTQYENSSCDCAKRHNPQIITSMYRYTTSIFRVPLCKQANACGKEQ